MFICLRKGCSECSWQSAVCANWDMMAGCKADIYVMCLV